MIVAVPVAAPDVVDDLATRQHEPGVCRNGLQDVELRPRQRHQPAVDRHLVGAHIDGQSTEAHHLLRRIRARTPGAPQYGLDAGDQLAIAERLDQIVVRPHGQTDDPVCLVPACGQHQDAAIRERADLPAHLNPIQSRQTQVEDDHVRVALPSLVDRLRPGVDDPRDEPRAGQVRGDDGRQRLLIVDHEQPLSGHE